MRRIAPVLLLFALLSPPAPARAQAPRQVRVELRGPVTLRALLEAGLDVTRARDGAWAELLEWPGDAGRLAALGAEVRLLDPDPGRTAAERARAELAARPARRARAGGAAYAPPPEGEGSVGGFWSLAEVKDKLDELVATDTRGLVADRLDTLGWSLQHRPIWGLELGLQAAAPDTRPVAFFNALTHAREPEGMQVLFHFIDDLLGHYDTDPVAKYLLDQRRLYFVPVVNPDGYAFNQRLYDSTASFGLWRKNLRDTDGNRRTNAGDGVDINRNYGFMWGYDDIGSSPTPSQQTYRGPSAFSEPETRVQRDAVAALKPVTGFSLHTWGDLLLHPWGYTTTGVPDSGRFQAWTDEMTRGNGCTGGPSPRVLYGVNGEFNDWAYGETALKPRAFTWTPEVGAPEAGFWPAPSMIVPLADGMLRACRTVAGIAGPWVRADGVTLGEGALNAGGLAHLSVRARNLGASGVAGPGLAASLTALDAGTEVLGGPVAYASLAAFATADPAEPFLVAAADTVTPGRLVRFRVDFTDAAGLHCRDTVEVIIGTPTVVYLNGFPSIAGLSFTGSWGVVKNDPARPSGYLTDSPAGRYASQMDAWAGPAAPLDLSHGVHAWAFYDSRWTFESDADGSMLQASLDGTSWTTVEAGMSTRSGPSSMAGAGLPVFRGSRWLWGPDRADLSPFAGSASVRLRFHSFSDPGFQLDGFSVDSLRVCVYDPAMQPAPVSVGPGGAGGRLSLAPPSPNPARDFVRFAFDLPPGAEGSALDVLDVQGRRVVSYAVPAARAGDHEAGSSWRWGWNLRDDGGRRVPPGVYLVRLRCGAGAEVRRIAVLP
jgi:carboxypeptidase T